MQKPPQYFEAILQLRHPTKEILAFAREGIIKSGRAHIAKEKNVPNGVDMYVSSQHFLQNFGKRLKEKFGGILVISCRIQTCSHVTSKDLYRVSVLFKPLKISKGDVVKIQEGLWKVVLINNQVQVQNVSSGEKKWLKLDVVERLYKV